MFERRGYAPQLKEVEMMLLCPLNTLHHKDGVCQLALNWRAIVRTQLQTCVTLAMQNQTPTGNKFGVCVRERGRRIGPVRASGQVAHKSTKAEREKTLPIDENNIHR